MLSVPFALYARDVQYNNDADADPANEIQTLGITGNNISLSKNGGTVALPGDNWGTQSAATDATLAGNETTSAPLKVAPQGATSGQVLKWNGTTWLPGSDLTGSTLPGGLNGSVQYNNSGSFGGDADLTWDKTNKRLGIGTSTPGSHLFINGRNENVDIKMVNSQTGSEYLDGFKVALSGPANGSAAVIWHHENAPMYFATNNLQRMTLSPDGKLGIGTSSPADLLHIGPLSGKGIVIDELNWADSARIFFREGGSDLYGGLLKYNAHQDKFIIGTVENGKTNNGITIDRISGNVGINNVSPTSKFDVKGDINVNNNRILNVANPVNAQDAVTKGYFDSQINGTSNYIPWFTGSNTLRNTNIQYSNDYGGSLAIGKSPSGSDSKITVNNQEVLGGTLPTYQMRFISTLPTMPPSTSEIANIKSNGDAYFSGSVTIGNSIPIMRIAELKTSLDLAENPGFNTWVKNHGEIQLPAGWNAANVRIINAEYEDYDDNSKYVWRKMGWSGIRYSDSYGKWSDFYCIYEFDTKNRKIIIKAEGLIWYYSRVRFLIMELTFP